MGPPTASASTAIGPNTAPTINQTAPSLFLFDAMYSPTNPKKTAQIIGAA